MRGPTRFGLLAISVVCMFAFMAASAFADADDQLLDKEGGVALRDVTTSPPTTKLQPDTLEFVNNGNVVLKVGTTTLECPEVELGTTVVNNKLGEVKLAVPFGVAENGPAPENCTVPTYFDTLANGAVGVAGAVATVTIADTAGPPIKVVLHNLNFSLEVAAGLFCTGKLNLVEGVGTNVKEGFVEEKPPNFNVQFTNAVVPVEGPTGCPTTSTLTANFFAETLSTKTDTVWFAS
jgi:hypothetical protein